MAFDDGAGSSAGTGSRAIGSIARSRARLTRYVKTAFIKSPRGSGFISECVELFPDLPDEAIVVGIVTQLHPAHPAGVRRDVVFRLDLVPGILLRIVAKHAGGLLALVEVRDGDKQLTFAVVGPMAGL